LRQESTRVLVALLAAVPGISMTSAGVAAAVTAYPPPKPIPGWTMELVAAAPVIRHPSVVCTAPDGRIFVAEDPMDISTRHANEQRGRIVCLRPDGGATVFAENLHAVFGLQYLEGRLYVLHNPKFSVFDDAEGVGANRVDLVEQTNPEPWALDWNDHVPANFRLAMDGFFYIAVGDKGLYGAVDRGGRRVDLRGGGVVRIRPDGTGLEVFSTGTRNILDVAMTAEDELFTYDNTDEHEWMGRLTHMVDGGFYGYPFDFIPRRPYTLWMLADYGPGAATGALAWNDDSLPPDWRGALILADFGQRNLRRVRLAREGATFHAAADELLFSDPPPDFRPVGIHETADGHGFFICDWQHVDSKERITVGRLWKLSANFTTNSPPLPAWFIPTAMGKPSNATTGDLIAGLSHPQRQVRLAAQRALARSARHGKTPASQTAAASPSTATLLAANAVHAALLAVLTNSAAEPARWHALWALDAIDEGRAARPAIMRLISDATTPPGVVRQAMRQLGGCRAPEAVPALTRRLNDTDASLRFHAATALRRDGDAAAAPALLRALNDPDLFARFAVFTALNQLGRAHPKLWPDLVSALGAQEPRVRESAFAALRETFDPALVDALAAAASDRTRPAAFRVTALELLAAIHRQPPPWKGEWWAYHPFRLSPPTRTVDWAGTGRILETLRAGVGDGDETIRLAAVHGIATAADRKAIPLLRQLWPREMSSVVRQALLVTLGDLGDSGFAPAIENLLGDAAAPEELRRAAFDAAAKLISKTTPPPESLSGALIAQLRVADLPESLRLAAVEAAGRAQLTNAIPELRSLARSGSAGSREPAVRAIAGFGAVAALPALSDLAADAPVETRREAIEALGNLRDKHALPLLLRAAEDPLTREAAWRSLAAMPSIQALDAYLAALGAPGVVLRDQARQALRAISDAALPELEKRAASLTPPVRAELRRVYGHRPELLTRPLFAAGDAEAPSPEDFARHALNEPGDPWRGQRIFFDEQRTACARCHSVHGWGGDVGPELTTAGAQFGRAALIEAVLYPSKTVREGYQRTELELKSGENLTGIVKAESAGELRFQESDGRIRAIPRDQVVARRNSPLSLMPDGLQSALTPDEFADLIAYLESMKSDPRRPRSEVVPGGLENLLAAPALDGWHGVTGRDPGENPIHPPRHWTLREGVLENDGGAAHLWTDRAFGDFELRFDWRWVDAPKFEEHPLIAADGTEERGEAGARLRERVLDSGDGGVFVRGLFAAQANLFCYPVGSGEFWELRESATGDDKRAFTPRRRADRPLGQWNRMSLLVRGDRVTVSLNGEEVIVGAAIPGLPARGPIGFQHEQGRLQIMNVFLREVRTENQSRK
jgi:putative heme-binding domain-containing protein